MTEQIRKAMDYVVALALRQVVSSKLHESLAIAIHGPVRHELYGALHLRVSAGPSSIVYSTLCSEALYPIDDKTCDLIKTLL